MSSKFTLINCITILLKDEAYFNLYEYDRPGKKARKQNGSLLIIKLNSDQINYHIGFYF